MTAVFHDQIESLLSLNYIIQLNNVRMADNLKYMNLPCNSFNITCVLYPSLFKNFNSDFHLSMNMDSLLDFAEGSSPNRLFESVIPDLHLINSSSESQLSNSGFKLCIS